MRTKRRYNAAFFLSLRKWISQIRFEMILCFAGDTSRSCTCSDNASQVTQTREYILERIGNLSATRSTSFGLGYHVTLPVAGTLVKPCSAVFHGKNSSTPCVFRDNGTDDGYVHRTVEPVTLRMRARAFREGLSGVKCIIFNTFITKIANALL